MKRREESGGSVVEFPEERVELVNDGSGRRQRHVYQLQNRGTGSVKVRAGIGPDSDPVLALVSGGEEKYVAPGLRLPVVLQYSPGSQGGRHRGCIEVFVNSCLALTIPITVDPPSPRLHLSQEVVDVGHLVTDHQIHTTSFTLSNLGSLQGTFTVDSSSLPDWITLYPTTGQLDPHHTTCIQIEILCKEEAQFSFPLRIHSLESVGDQTVSPPPLVLTLCGILQSRSLKLLDSSSPDSSSTLDCITFQPIYYNTTTTKQVILFNDSPASTDYLCVLNKTAPGSDVTRATGVAAALVEEGGENPGGERVNEQGSTLTPESLITIEPAQDSLLPFEKRRVKLIFAPLFVSSESGWSHLQATPTRRDYTMFLRFMAVNANRDRNGSLGDLEVPVCASALPLEVQLDPSSGLQFGSSPTMQSISLLLNVLNKSDTLPLYVTTHRLPHYSVQPPSGHLPPSQSLSLSVTFTPKQLGPLNAHLLIDLLSPEGGKYEEVVSTLEVELKGEGVSGKSDRKQAEESKRMFAHPDDLATSIRPYDGYKIVTPYTGTPRHTYVDRDYAYSQRERQHVQWHRDQYIHYLRQSQTHRRQAKKDKTLRVVMCGPERELGMMSLKAPTSSPTVSSCDRGSRRKARIGGGGGGGEGRGVAGIMTSDDLNFAKSVEMREVDVCSAAVNGPQAASEVNIQLSPHQLSLFEIDPRELDYGVIAFGSLVEKTVSLRNSLKQHVSISFKLAGSGVECPLFTSSSSSSSSTSSLVVVPPLSFTRLPFTVKPNATGVLERCVECVVNGHSVLRLPVHVEAVPLSLSLSTNTLTLSQPPMVPPTAGLRGSLEVMNELNIPASFQWHAREGVDTSVFFMVHPTGVVPAHSSLHCEFVCLPTYESDDSALFRLVVLGEGEGGGGGGGGEGGVSGSTLNANNLLTLKTELGHSVCSFKERRVLFGSVPLGLTTIQTVHILNHSQSHAFFKVLNPEPCAGLTVQPESGCVPVGGVSALELHLHPETEALFDTELVVAVRRGKRLALKLVGAAEKPRVTIDRESFAFGGVYSGSRSSLPFTISNLGSTRCELSFDFSYLTDFSLDLPPQTSPYEEVTSSVGEVPGVYSLRLPAKTSTQCHLIFTPSDVAAYDFQLPVLVNGARPLSPPPSPWPPSSHHPSKITLLPTGTKTSNGITPCRRVLATGLRPPITLSLSHFSFSFPVGFLETMTHPVLHQQPAELKNVSDSPILWTLVTAGTKRIEDGTFCLVESSSGEPLSLPSPDFSSPAPGGGEIGHLRPQGTFQFTVKCNPGHHGEFSAELPLVIHHITNEQETPQSPLSYCSLSVSARVPASRLSLSTTVILLQPVPLDITISVQYTLRVQNFPNPVDVEVILPPIPEGSSLMVKFPQGSHVEECLSEDGVELPVEIDFSSSLPVSLFNHLVFRDTNSNKKVRVTYALAADNSVLSVAQFLAQSVAIATVQLNNQHIPMLSVSSSRSGGVVPSSSTLSMATSHTRPLSINTSSLSEDLSYSEIFLQECVNAVCRWVSCYGWSQGTRHITSPTDLRERVGHNVPKKGVKQRSSIKVDRGQLVELVSHLCGRLPPGIPMNPPPCTTPSEKINQQYSTLNTIITFLKNQGGQVWCLTADSLLDYQDYQQWLLDCKPCPSPLPPASSQEEFLERSLQAWTYLLLLIIKVLVLPQVTKVVPVYLRDTLGDLLSNTTTSTSSNNSTHDSNIYGAAERVILAWLNHHYSTQRASVFTGYEEESEEVREVVNFDVDLMDSSVLACVLSAYCPFLIPTHFSGLYSHPSSPEQCSHNALILINALTNIGITYDCQASDITAPTPVFLLLFCCHLYHTLPSLSPPPSHTILCQGLLHSNIRQMITVNNPSSKPLVYRVLLRGEDANKFNVFKETITMEGGGNVNMEVVYKASHLAQSEAVLLLVPGGGGGGGGGRNDKGGGGRGGLRGTSLAFRLVGKVSGAKPKSQVQVSGALYQKKVVSLEVTSSFQSSAVFNISVFETTDGSLLSTLSPSSRKKTTTRSLGIIPVCELQKSTEETLKSFNPQLRQLRVNPSAPASLDVTFLPLTTQPRHCTIVLSNNTLGDIVLLVTASIQLPFPTLPKTVSAAITSSGVSDSHFFLNPQSQTVHLKAYVGETIREDLLVTSENSALEKALFEVCQWDMDQEELRQRHLTHSFRNPALKLAKKLQIKPEEKSSLLPVGENSGNDPRDLIVFRIEGSDGNFKFPENVSVPAVKGAMGCLPVEFLSEDVGQFECRVVLKSKWEMRVFIIESTVMPRGREVQLEFTTTATQPLSQDIPIINPSTVEWPLKAILHGSDFTGPDSLISQPLSTTHYPLTFNPNKEGRVEGELCLVNENDGIEHRFQLRGIAERPLAQELIKIHTQANSSMTHILHVPNHNERTTEFKVESDITCVSGPSSITIIGGDLIDYPLIVKPIRRGVFSGAVAFVAQSPSAMIRRRSLMSAVPSQRGRQSTPHHVWFQLELTAKPAPPDQTVPISCPTLSSLLTHLLITNSHPHTLHFNVMVEGTGLSGPDSLLVEPGSTTTYPLTFSPTLIGQSSGGVVFDRQEDGEFWYQLDLQATDPEPVTLPNISCQLGKTEQVNIQLSNPLLDQSVVFTCDSSNTRHFLFPTLISSKVEIEAGESIEVPVLFKPSCVGPGEHIVHISFTSAQFGEQVFILQGEGTEPSQMEPTTIRANLNSNTTHVVTFTNPLDTPTHFRVALSDSSHSGSFCLLLKRLHRILLHPGVSLDIPVMFVPEKMQTHSTKMTVTTDSPSRSGTKLTWCYPITGEPQFRPLSPSSAPRIICQAKERVEEKLEVLLLDKKSPEAAVFQSTKAESEETVEQEVQSGVIEGYSYKLVCEDSECSSIVENCMVVRLLEKKVDGDGLVTLVFGFVFLPPKAFSCAVELTVGCGGSGGVWKFPLQLSATAADPDDVIMIEGAGLNQESQIQFRLTSMTEHPIPFTARLAHGSAPDITVYPTSGELAPIHSPGTLFFITYKPRVYGRDHRARLIVNCQSNEWCYEIVGRPVAYSPPTNTSARVHHRATPPLLMPTQRGKNFVRRNIMKLGKSRQPVQ